MVEFSAFPSHIRQSRPAYNSPSLQLEDYPADPGLCDVIHLREYIVRTMRIGDQAVYKLYVRPHRGVPKGTLAKWLLTVTMGAGLQVTLFN